MTPLTVEALGDRVANARVNTRTTEAKPSLDCPAVGNPISHGQIVDLWKDLNQPGATGHSLENLLKGTSLYFPPPPTRPEPVSFVHPLSSQLVQILT